MKKRNIKKILSLIVLFCMIFTQLVYFSPMEADASVNTDNVANYTDLFSNVTTSPGYMAGYNNFRIPGIVLSQGTNTVTGEVYDVILAYAEARGGNGSDWAQSDILVKRSVDGGLTWSTPIKVADGLSIPTSSPNTEFCMNNPVMITEKNSSVVHLLHGKQYHEVFYRRSEDAGLTWSPEVNITNVFDEFRDGAKGSSPEDYFNWLVTATGPGHGIQLSNGRLVVPVWLANGGSATSHNNSVVTTVYSDDSGTSWHRGSIISKNQELMTTGDIMTNPNESTVVELSDGRVMISMRTSAPGYRRAYSISPDGVSGWSPVQLDDELPEPNCFGSMVLFDENRIMFVNPNSETARENLTVRMSEDNGQTWAYSRLLQLGGAAYSDIAVGSDKSIYVFYERDPYKNLTVAKFGLNWITSPPPVAQLNNVFIQGADLSPMFFSERYLYDATISAEMTSINITPVTFPNSGASISVNGKPSGSGETVSIPINGESVNIEVKVSLNEQSNTYTFRVRKKHLVTDWRFEKSAEDGIFDSSGFGNTSAVINNVQYGNGYIGNGLVFDGSADKYVDVAGIDATKFDTGDFSVTAWVYTDALTSSQQMIFWYGRNYPSDDISQWWLRIKPTTSKLSANVEFSNGNKSPGGIGTEVNASTSDAPIKPGVWHHIVAQRKNGIMEIYVDGKLKTRKGSSPLNVSEGPETNLYIGRAKGTSNLRPWLGKMDEIRLYNYGLSQAEINVLAMRNPVSFSELLAKIEEIKALDSSVYTDKSWADLQAAIISAETAMESLNATQTSIDLAMENLQNAVGNLQIKPVIPPEPTPTPTPQPTASPTPEPASPAPQPTTEPTPDTSTGPPSSTPDLTPVPVQTPTPTPEQKAEADLNVGAHNKTIEVNVDNVNGTASVCLNQDDLESAFDNARKQDNGKKVVNLKLPGIEGINKYEIQLPAAVLTSQEGMNNINLNTSICNVNVPDNMLTDLDIQNNDNIVIDISRANKDDLPQKVKEAIGNRPFINISIKINGKEIQWRNDSAPVKVTVPYMPADSELYDPEYIVIWYIDDSGNVIPVSDSVYSPETASVSFTTVHFSKFAVVFSKKSFNDLDNFSWAGKEINVLYSKGIISGTSKDTFSPEKPVTRAEYLYLLVKTLGIYAEADDNFTDIGNLDYYYKEIGIAKKLGITQGVGDNKFNPGEYITRQDIMVLTHRALMAVKLSNAEVKNESLDKFIDGSDIQSYALDSVKTMIDQGLIIGNGDRIKPMEDTTRAEAAVILYRIYNKCKYTE